MEETGALVQVRCQRRRWFDSVCCDEKLEWGMVHLAGRAELGAWDDDKSGCFMCSTGYGFFGEVCVFIPLNIPVLFVNSV